MIGSTDQHMLTSDRSATLITCVDLKGLFTWYEGHKLQACLRPSRLEKVS